MDEVSRRVSVRCDWIDPREAAVAFTLNFKLPDGQDPDITIRQAHEAIEVARVFGDEIAEASIQCGLCKVLREVGHLKEALEAIQIAHEICRRTDAKLDGREAIEKFAGRPFDLILMDCQMPVVDGFEATSQIRKLESGTGRRIPIIAMTANAAESDRQACLSAGMDDFISKPITQQALAQVILRTVQMKSGNL